MKYASVEVTVLDLGSAPVRASNIEMFVIPEQEACLDWDETEKEMLAGP